MHHDVVLILNLMHHNIYYHNQVVYERYQREDFRINY